MDPAAEDPAEKGGAGRAEVVAADVEGGEVGRARPVGQHERRRIVEARVLQVERHRLRVHHWSPAEKQATVKELQTAETDLKQALAYAEAKWGAGTPRGMPESQARSNQQLAEALTVIDNDRHLILHAQWEEKADGEWAARTRKQEEADKRKVKESYDARLKSVDKEITQKLEQQKKELAQKKQQAAAQIRAEFKAAIKTIDDQIKQLRGK
jgi:hypothetical protein